MTARDDIREFLTSRRAKVRPEDAGLPAYGRNRRVQGLRREEVALLAGISVEYYTRLERGSVTGVSEPVLDGVARALQLDDAETAHLFHLVRTLATPARRAVARRGSRQRVRPTVQRILDSMPGLPAYVRNGRMDILAANDLGRALYVHHFEQSSTPNSARFLFLDPRATEFFVDYDKVTDDCVAFLRAEAGRSPFDKALTDLVGELSTRSEQFRVRWAAHDVRYHRTGVKRFRHPLVGDLTLDYEAFELPADEGLRLNVYSPEPGSPTADAVGLLASWVATEKENAWTS